MTFTPSSSHHNFLCRIIFSSLFLSVQLYRRKYVFHTQQMPFFHAFMHSFGILEKKSDKIKLLMRENRRKTLCIWGEKLLKYSNIRKE